MCENLERLLICECEGLRKFRVCSESLKVLELSCLNAKNVQDSESSIEIRTPNLSRIEIVEFYVANYIGDLSSVVEAEVSLRLPSELYRKCWSNTINLLSGVENLKIESCFPMFVYSDIPPDECFQYQRFKHLELKTSYSHTQMLGLAYLLERSPALETLVLDYSLESEEEAVSFDSFASEPFLLRIPSLREIKMKRFRKTSAEYFVLILFRKLNVVLKKIVLVPFVRAKTQTVVLDLTTDDSLDFCLRGYCDCNGCQEDALRLE